MSNCRALVDLTTAPPKLVNKSRDPVRSTGDIEQFSPPPLQFQHNVINVEIVFSEASFWLSISTLYNFNGRAQRAREKIRYNFDRHAISTFFVFAKYDNFNVVIISTFWKP